MTPTKVKGGRLAFERWAPSHLFRTSTQPLCSVITEQGGSALIETMASIFMLQVLIAAGLAGSYLSFARVWCDRSAYEAAVCLASLTQKSECERRLRNDFRVFPVGKLDHLSLDRNSSHTSATFKYELYDRLEVRAHSELSLPLTSFAQHGSIL